MYHIIYINKVLIFVAVLCMTLIKLSHIIVYVTYKQYASIKTQKVIPLHISDSLIGCLNPSMSGTTTAKILDQDALPVTPVQDYFSFCLSYVLCTIVGLYIYIYVDIYLQTSIQTLDQVAKYLVHMLPVLKSGSLNPPRVKLMKYNINAWWFAFLGQGRALAY